MQMLRNASLFALLSLALCLLPLAAALVYVSRPSERNLAFMRPMSLAGLFAALAGGVLGLINVLQFGWTRELTADTLRVMTVGAAESLVTLFVGFAALAFSWILVAVGMSRKA